MKPTQVATDRRGATQQLFDYVDAIQQAMADKKVSPDEFSKISQMGANAKASLQAHGGPELQGFSGGIDTLTTQLARGEWPAARGDLDGFEHSLPNRPSRP